jgi:hypothetical protein
MAKDIDLNRGTELPSLYTFGHAAFFDKNTTYGGLSASCHERNALIPGDR